ncbi:hypothetical protein GCK72_021661 [Caenorhabditis remanei]|uniref:C-type lectin domain-containing protein n=1 Tax=Caenorhabditis remanei TaxID=31234 RepID=A0A6A5GKC1_CAERE|nr:hypothetical protein GCK72_021661 [Caenorhabditis remanei]KAF1755093.1 hypothetical protein GCK72_021661 [Caenorhabditis remanei]
MQGIGVTRLWLGLYCDHSTPESCLWDYGQGNALLTNRFLSDSPDISKGKCVYMDGKSGNWSSVDCEEKMPYMCELPQTLEDPSCDHNYYGYCYIPHSTLLAYGDAQKVCTQNNADLISIHSEFENVFVSNIFKTPGAILIGGVALSKVNLCHSYVQAIKEINKDYIWLGGFAASKSFVSWMDGTPMNYNGVSIRRIHNEI